MPLLELVPRSFGEYEAAGGGRGLQIALAARCALPTVESLLMQSLVRVFGDEFAGHIGRPCPLPRELPFHKIVDWDAEAGRFAYDLAYAEKQPDWTTGS